MPTEPTPGGDPKLSRLWKAYERAQAGLGGCGLACFPSMQDQDDAFNKAFKGVALAARPYIAELEKQLVHHRPSPGPVVTDDELERVANKLLRISKMVESELTIDRLEWMKQTLTALLTRAGGRVVDRNMLITVIANVMDGYEDLVTTDAIADAILTALSSRPAADGK